MEVFASIHIQDKHSPKLKFNKSPLCSSGIRTEGRIRCPWIINISASATTSTDLSPATCCQRTWFSTHQHLFRLLQVGLFDTLTEVSRYKHSNYASLACINKACNEETQNGCTWTMWKFVQTSCVRTWWRNTMLYTAGLCYLTVWSLTTHIWVVPHR